MVWDSVYFQRLLWQRQADWESPYNLSPSARKLVTPSSCWMVIGTRTKLLWFPDLGSDT